MDVTGACFLVLVLLLPPRCPVDRSLPGWMFWRSRNSLDLDRDAETTKKVGVGVGVDAESSPSANDVNERPNVERASDSRGKLDFWEAFQTGRL